MVIQNRQRKRRGKVIIGRYSENICWFIQGSPKLSYLIPMEISKLQARKPVTLETQILRSFEYGYKRDEVSGETRSSVPATWTNNGYRGYAKVQTTPRWKIVASQNFNVLLFELNIETTFLDFIDY